MESGSLSRGEAAKLAGKVSFALSSVRTTKNPSVPANRKARKEENPGDA